MSHDETSKKIDTGLVRYVEKLNEKRAAELKESDDLDGLWMRFFQYFNILPSSTKPAREIDNSNSSG